MKGFLIGCGLLIVIVVLLLGGYVYSKKDEWVAAGEAMRNEGLEFGKGVTERQCLDRAMVRYKEDKTAMGAIRTRLWLGGCLETSMPSADFCSGIPGQTEVIATATWRLKVCEQYGFANDSTCGNIVDEIQEYCQGDNRKNKPARSVVQPSTITYTPPPEPVSRRAPVTTATEAPLVETTRVIEQVYVDNTTKLYYAENCTNRPANAYRMSRRLAISQGFKEGKCAR